MTAVTLTIGTRRELYRFILLSRLAGKGIGLSRPCFRHVLG